MNHMQVLIHSNRLMIVAMQVAAYSNNKATI